MNKLNNKGFTLVEVLAVVVIISLLLAIVVPNVISAIINSKETSYDIMVDNIVTASIQMFEEVDSNGGVILYEHNGSSEGAINVAVTSYSDKPDQYFIEEVNLQTLVSNGFLSGIKEEEDGKKIINPETNEDIGECLITIVKTIDENGKVSYIVESKSADDKCPSNDDYKGVK